MKPVTVAPAALAQLDPHELALSGYWTALGTGGLDLGKINALHLSDQVVLDGAGIDAFDSIGARIVQKWLGRLRAKGHAVELRAWSPDFSRLLEVAAQPAAPTPTPPRQPGLPERVGRSTVDLILQAGAMLAFVGQSSAALAGSVAHPKRMRWRPILHNIRTAGFDALPIVGLLSFLLGVVIAYQAATQLSRYGADLFVADLVGLSVLREFAPLMTAIIVAGRSGSAYAAQIGTMSVTEEIDAMRTIGMSPIEVLVLPKIIALVIALPLLTLFADAAGLFGGMIMARAQLGMGFDSFIDRVTGAVSVTSYLIGIGKAPVFAAIIAVVGCFQGFRTEGGADAVGQQTTRSVVHSIFLVIVADALFSIVFSFLDL